VVQAAGVGAAAEDAVKDLLRAAILKVDQVVRGVPPPQALVPNGGDNSLKRKEPAAFGGASKRARKAAVDASLSPPRKLLARPVKATKPRGFRRQLLASRWRLCCQQPRRALLELLGALGGRLVIGHGAVRTARWFWTPARGGKACAEAPRNL
jgi:hypothetical protein